MNWRIGMCIVGVTPIQAVAGDVMASTTDAPASHGTVLRAEFIAEDDPAKRGSFLVGNVGVEENFNDRRLIVELRNVANNAVVLRQEFEAPSQTIQGDPCFISSLNGLAVQQKQLSVTFEYQFACGAGSGTEATYTVASFGQELRVTSVALVEASRDGIIRLEIDYQKGLVARSIDRPEDDKPSKPTFRRIAKGAVAMTRNVFMVCPQPLKGKAMPACQL